MPRPTNQEYRSYDSQSFRAIPQLHLLSPALLTDIEAVARVLPFKVSRYVLDELIDWKSIPDDPIFRLTFPQAEMLHPDELDRVKEVLITGQERELTELTCQIHQRMNPHPGDQQLNAAFIGHTHVPGLQHKYRETVLFFPKQGQTCHSFCTFCFRWPQFVRSSAFKFEASDAHALYQYLRQHEEVSDLLVTGGDPMTMSARRLSEYLRPLLSPELTHIQNVRIGTKVLSYWPYRLVTDPDSEQLLLLLRQLVDGGKHVSVMAHINHWRELATDIVEEAIQNLKRAGVAIRSQAPVLRHINDDPVVWRRMWLDQVRLGIVPYYMFIERDTGPKNYFELPLADALQIYNDAIRGLSGIVKTACGPVMSAAPGKIQIIGAIELERTKYFLLHFLRARDPEWGRKPFLAKYSTTATWLDQLEPPGDEDKFFFEEGYQRFVESRIGLLRERPTLKRERQFDKQFDVVTTA